MNDALHTTSPNPPAYHPPLPSHFRLPHSDRQLRTRVHVRPTRRQQYSRLRLARKIYLRRRAIPPQRHWIYAWINLPQAPNGQTGIGNGVGAHAYDGIKFQVWDYEEGDEVFVVLDWAVYELGVCGGGEELWVSGLCYSKVGW